MEFGYSFWRLDENEYTFWDFPTFKGIRIVRPFVQFGLLALAGYVGLTRISDFKHHPGDVLTGEIS